MNGRSITSFHKFFDFRLAGRWLLFGGVVGIVSGLGAIVFQILLDLVQNFSFVHLMGLNPQSPGGEKHIFHFLANDFTPWLVVLVPLVGGLIVGVIVKYLAPEAEGHGTDEVIKAYHKKRGIIRPIVPFVKLIASVITIGTGGSGGREGPIAQIGAGFGSFFATRFKMNTRTRRWLLAAGMGAGIGSIFRSPLAGAIFAGEVLYSDPEVESEVILPAAVSSIIAYSVYSFYFGWGHMFTKTHDFGFSNPLELIPYLFLAIAMAVLALLYTKTFYKVNDLFKKLKVPTIIKPAIGGAITGIIALVAIYYIGDSRYVVDVMGGGYGILQEIFSNGFTNIGVPLLLVVGFGKIITTSFSIGSGGSAGVFGPSMVIGGTLGGAIGLLLQMLMPDIVLHPTTFAIVGMAGFFAAAANTPLSTIIMVSELTGNYELLLPSMWVCSIAYLLGKKWTIYKSQVPNHNYSQAHFGKYAPDILGTTTVLEAFSKTRKFTTVPINSTMETIFDILETGRQRVFPVVDEHKELVGVFRLEDVTHLLHGKNPHEKNVKDVMHPVIAKVTTDETIQKAYSLMTDYLVEELLVVEDDDPNKVIGIITSSDIVLYYNRKLTEIKGYMPD